MPMESKVMTVEAIAGLLGKDCSVPCRVGPLQLAGLVPSLCPGGRASPAGRQAKLEACGVFTPLNAGDCCLVWCGACRAGLFSPFTPSPSAIWGGVGGSARPCPSV